MQTLDRLFANYAADHQHPLNQRLHVVCVPLITWCVVALLFCVPLPQGLPSGSVALLALVPAAAWWLHLSRRMGLGLLLLMALALASCRALMSVLGVGGLAALASALFVLAWIGQFLGHHVEGRRPSFLTDLVYLLVGPLWVWAKLHRRLGLPQ